MTYIGKRPSSACAIRLAEAKKNGTEAGRRSMKGRPSQLPWNKRPKTATAWKDHPWNRVIPTSNPAPPEPKVVVPRGPWNAHLLVECKNTSDSRRKPESYTCMDSHIAAATMPFHLSALFRQTKSRQPIYDTLEKAAEFRYTVHQRHLVKGDVWKKRSSESRQTLINTFFSWAEQQQRYNMRAVLLRQARQYLEENYGSLEAAWRAMDRDHSATLEPIEFLQHMKHAGMSSRQIYYLIDTIDPSGDGVSFGEFIKWFSVRFYSL